MAVGGKLGFLTDQTLMSFKNKSCAVRETGLSLEVRGKGGSECEK